MSDIQPPPDASSFTLPADCGDHYIPATRTRLPCERPGLSLRFVMQRGGGDAPLKVYLTANAFPGTRRCAEIFLKADKEGDFASAALNVLAQVISVGLQHGVPLRAFTSKMVGMQSEPFGFTQNADFPLAKSAWDLIGRWLEARFDVGEVR